MARHRLIVNPTAGRGEAGRSIERIEQTLRRLGVEFDLVRTERPMHAAELAQRAVRDGCEVVVSVGGDGTANEVLNGLLAARSAGEGEATMGILCVGRGNDFAFGVGIPHDLDAGCRALADGHRRTIDVGWVEGEPDVEARHFGNGVGIGFDTVVGFEAAKLKRLHGFLGYFVAAMKTIFLYFTAPAVRIEVDDETFDQRALMVSIMNGRRMGGGFMMAPSAQIDDGEFNLCIVRQISRLGIFAMIPRFMKGTQEGRPPVRTGRTRRISVTAVDGVLPAHADGETLCVRGKRLTLEVRPRQIDMVCPAPIAR